MGQEVERLNSPFCEKADFSVLVKTGFSLSKWGGNCRNKHMQFLCILDNHFNVNFITKYAQKLWILTKDFAKEKLSVLYPK